MTATNPPHRPTKLTPEVEAGVARELANGVPRWVAARRAGIGTTTFKRWMNLGRQPGDACAPHRSFRAAVKKAEADAVAKFASVIETAAVDTWTAAAWWLERRHPDDWGNPRNELREVKRQLDALAALLGTLSRAPDARRQDRRPRPDRPPADRARVR